MQSKGIESIDARTFQEIWNSLDPRSEERNKLREKVIKACMITDVAFYKWCNGDTAPRFPDVKRRISQIVNGQLKIKTTGPTLFPIR